MADYLTILSDQKEELERVASYAKVSRDEETSVNLNSNVAQVVIGVEKFKEVCRHPNAYFETCFPLASSMAVPAAQACKNKEFEDTAYFEPFYLKEFVAGISKKSIL